MSGPWKPRKNLNKQVVAEESFSTSINSERPSVPPHQVRTDSNRFKQKHQPAVSTKISIILNHVLPTDPLRHTVYLPSILLHWPGDARPGDPTSSPVLPRLRVTVFVPLAHLEICLPPKQPHPQKLKKQSNCKLARVSPSLCNDCLHGTFFSGLLSKC